MKENSSTVSIVNATELTTVILKNKLGMPYTFIFLKSWPYRSCHLYILSTDI